MNTVYEFKNTYEVILEKASEALVAGLTGVIKGTLSTLRCNFKCFTKFNLTLVTKSQTEHLTKCLKKTKVNELIKNNFNRKVICIRAKSCMFSDLGMSSIFSCRMLNIGYLF